jgi:Tfp pilus assembly ATPase PilU
MLDGGLTVIVEKWTSPILIHVEVPLALRVDKRLLQSVLSQKLLSGNQSLRRIAE